MSSEIESQQSILPGFKKYTHAKRNPLPSIVKWAGGKSRELDKIIPALPNQFDRYFEPFVGGGAVFFAIKFSNALLNDKSSELISLYRFVRSADASFFQALELINDRWRAIDNLIDLFSEDLISKYREVAQIGKSIQNAERASAAFVETAESSLRSLLRGYLNINISEFIHRVESSLSSKITRTHKLDAKKGPFTDKEILDNLEAAIRTGFYSHLRGLYNDPNRYGLDKLHTIAIFYFIREFCYSSMFRYNSGGHFNVPYGGLQYNRKDFAKKIHTLQSDEYVHHLGKAELFNQDFIDFLSENEPADRDFLFLDPPYDSNFSTYAGNSFGPDEHKQLAYYLKNQCSAMFMLVIQASDLIDELYRSSSFDIYDFDKTYAVSFMDRNNRSANHLLITNY